VPAGSGELPILVLTEPLLVSLHSFIFLEHPPLHGLKAWLLKVFTTARQAASLTTSHTNVMRLSVPGASVVVCLH
jgi:hypothetical protein